MKLLALLLIFVQIYVNREGECKKGATAQFK